MAPLAPPAHHLALTTALLLTATSVTVATATAPPPTTAATVDYTATVGETSTVIRTDAGSLMADNGVFTILAVDGTILGGSELAVRVDDFVCPIAVRISDRTATRTPQFDLEHAVYQPVALPLRRPGTPTTANRPPETTSAWVTAIGTLVGGLGGAAVGCLGTGDAGPSKVNTAGRIRPARDQAGRHAGHTEPSRTPRCGRIPLFRMPRLADRRPTAAHSYGRVTRWPPRRKPTRTSRYRHVRNAGGT